MYDVSVWVTCNNKAYSFLASRSLVSLKGGEQGDKPSPVSFIVAVFRNSQIKGSLPPLKPQPRPGALLPLSLVSSAAPVATMLSSAALFLLQLKDT